MTEIPPYSNFRSYQIATRRTVQTYLTKDERNYQNTIGLIGEVAEVVELLLTNSPVYDAKNIVKELGDVLWYMSRLLDDFDLDMEKVAKCTDTLSFGMSLIPSEIKFRDAVGLHQTMIGHAKQMVSLAGRISEHLKKHFFQKHDLDLYEVSYLCRKLMYEMAMVAFWVHCTMEDVAERNIEKSRKRYPNGFTSENSIGRIDLNN